MDFFRGSLADNRTLQALDFAAICDKVIAQTQTGRGREYAKSLAPFEDFARIAREQAATAHVHELLTTVDMHILPAADVGELARRAGAGSSLSGEELRAIGKAIASAAAAHAKATEKTSGPISGILENYKSLARMTRALDEALDERGSVLDRASPALGRLRRNLLQAHAQARDFATSLLRSAKLRNAIQDAIVTVRDGRFVIPIKAEFSGEVPGIVHDTSASGQTLFIEPLAALEQNNRVRRLQSEEEHEVARILAELSTLTGTHAAQIEANVEMLAQLDLLVAKALVALGMKAHSPQLSDLAEMVIERGRHPLLGDRAVPQSLALDESTRFLVISGPNMGGKTVTLKMTGLFLLMTYCGLMLPAEPATRIGRFGKVIADIGDEQSIAANTSTFSAHLRRLQEIVEQADSQTVVLVDEIGAGTEPASGAALAIALLEQLLNKNACGIVTTHSTELKLFAHETARAANASVRFDPNSFAPTYHLDIGTPGQSLAFSLARALGIPNDLIARAQRLLGEQDRQYETALTQLSQARALVQQDRDRVEQERLHLRELQAVSESKAQQLENERRSFLEQAETRLRQVLTEFAARLARAGRTREPKITRSQAELLQRTLDEIHADIGISPQKESGAGGPTGQSFSPGDPIRILSLAQDAVVVADNGDTILAAIGPMKTLVAKTDVRRTAASRATRGAPSETLPAAASGSMPELDVRGKRFAEAQPLVDRWIDEAILAGNSPLRLIHGKGTGMLGRGLQEFLREHPLVKGVRYGDEDEGGSGVTILELR